MKYFDATTPSECVFHRILEKRAAQQPDATFFTFEDQVFSYADFNARANQMARRLREEGVEYGSAVAVLMKTSPDYLLLWFALGKLGAIEVPINCAYYGDILLHQLRTSNATFAVVDSDFNAAMQAVINESAVEKCFVRGRLIEPGQQPWWDFSQLQAHQNSDNLGVEVAHSDPGGIIFTSGTTGPSKGVLLSFHYLTAYGVMYADVNALQADDVIYNFLPFFHMSGKFKTIATLVCGGKMRLKERLSISGFLDEVREYGVTNFVGVGGICNMLLSRPEEPSDAETSIRTIYAVPDPDAAHHELERRFHCKITTVFGSTEVGLPLFRGADDGYRAASCGRVSPLYEVKIVDRDDNEVATGAVGEIVVRPKRPYLVASGYVGMPEQTIAAWRNLWMHTGDSGRVDEEGWFYFEDRVSDSLRRRGENISSFEVENLVAKHPAVSEVAAVAYPSELGEDEVRVFVLVRSGHSLEAEALFQHCGECMPYFMVPRYIDIVDELPRTPTAKIEKYKLRKAEKKASTWDCQAHGWVVNRGGVAKVAAVSNTSTG
ncbi:MAG: ATP-dependent acyl-CoA ligase [Gammaproteobacteria bacterium]|nr:ATP-dependent acyl-CoA ligase [Gammaproteobacteria bacterium]